MVQDFLLLVDYALPRLKCVVHIAQMNDSFPVMLKIMVF